MNVHSINTWDEYYSYLQETETNPNKANRKGDTSDGITNCLSHLLAEYGDDYAWYCNVDKSALTSDVSSFIPIEMLDEPFPKMNIEDATKLAGVENETSYGGCGPIASMGILDYFARYLGYKKIIRDSTYFMDRLEIATEVLENTYFSIFGNEDFSLVWLGL